MSCERVCGNGGTCRVPFCGWSLLITRRRVMLGPARIRGLNDLKF